MDAERTRLLIAQGKGKDHKLKIKDFILFLFIYLSACLFWWVSKSTYFLKPHSLKLSSISNAVYT